MNILIVLAVVFVIGWLYQSSKSAKDPNVIEASNLGIPINRYVKYKEWSQKYKEISDRYGIDSKEAYQYMKSLNIKYPNEWRRFNEREMQKMRDDIMSDLEELKRNK